MSNEYEELEGMKRDTIFFHRLFNNTAIRIIQTFNEFTYITVDIIIVAVINNNTRKMR
jgi:hypothetical protein